jgi:hypothetical protein
MANQMFLMLAAQVCYYKARVREQANNLAMNENGPVKDVLRKRLVIEREAAKRELVYMLNAHAQARRYTKRAFKKQLSHQPEIPIIHDPHGLPDLAPLIEEKILELKFKNNLNFLYDEDPDIDIKGTSDPNSIDNFGSMKTGTQWINAGVHFSHNASSSNKNRQHPGVVDVNHGEAVDPTNELELGFDVLNEEFEQADGQEQIEPLNDNPAVALVLSEDDLANLVAQFRDILGPN